MTVTNFISASKIRAKEPKSLPQFIGKVFVL